MRYKVFLASVLMAAFLLAFLSPTHSRPSFKITTRPNFVDSLPGDTAVFEKVEVEASVDKDAWRGHLQNELQAVVEKAARKGMKPGEYTIMVRFLVQKVVALLM